MEANFLFSTNQHFPYIKHNLIHELKNTEAAAHGCSLQWLL